MRFPPLAPDEGELLAERNAGESLLSILRTIFRHEYGLEPSIEVKGSTAKGTSLRRELFGGDIDVSVLSDADLVDRIAYRSELFEGCQLLSLPFLDALMTYFPKAYHAGHRISAAHSGYGFDFSITDRDKDLWKWAYGRSYLALSDEQSAEVRRAKYYFKKLGVYGSDVHGVVGPAVEMAVLGGHSFETLLEAIADLDQMDTDAPFRVVGFPDAFYSLFPEPEDYVAEKMLDSFRLTVPVIYNQLIAIARRRPESLEDLFTSQGVDRVEFPTRNSRVALYMLRETETNASMWMTRSAGRVVVYAKRVPSSVAESVRVSRALPPVGVVPKATVERLFPGLPYSVFIGQPPPQRNRADYVPIDLLVRPDGDRLADVMLEGQRRAS